MATCPIHFPHFSLAKIIGRHLPIKFFSFHHHHGKFRNAGAHIQAPSLWGKPVMEDRGQPDSETFTGETTILPECGSPLITINGSERVIIQRIKHSVDKPASGGTKSRGHGSSQGGKKRV